MDCNPPGSSVHGILQARILEWVALPSCRGSFPPRDWTHVSYISCIGRRVLYTIITQSKIFQILQAVWSVSPLFNSVTAVRKQSQTIHQWTDMDILQWNITKADGDQTLWIPGLDHYSAECVLFPLMSEVTCQYHSVWLYYEPSVCFWPLPLGLTVLFTLVVCC